MIAIEGSNGRSGIFPRLPWVRLAILVKKVILVPLVSGILCSPVNFGKFQLEFQLAPQDEIIGSSEAFG